MPVEIYLAQRMDVLKSVANSAKTLVMELFMDVNDIELFEESTRKAREEAELMKKKAGLLGEQVWRCLYIYNVDYTYKEYWYIHTYRWRATYILQI